MGGMDPSSGQPSSGELFQKFYEQLRAVASRELNTGRRVTIQTTALVHEAYMKLANANPEGWRSERGFMATAVKAVRQVLVSEIRKRKALKRASSRNVPMLGEPSAEGELPVDQILEIDEALAELERLNPRHAQLVELRFFGGLSVEAAAEHMGVSVSTAEADWRVARAWLSVRVGATV